MPLEEAYTQQESLNLGFQHFLGIDKVNIDLPGKKVFVTSSLSSEEILESLKKTGKAVTFVGVQG